MTGNRSLDEFGSATTHHEGTDVTATERPDPASDDEPEPPASAAQITSTYEWRPDGAPCATCGRDVRERWRDSDGLVCHDCKVW